MGVLARSAALTCALAGCYAPDIRDCTLACGSSADCAQDQVCGSDMMCAAADIAGTCSVRAATDAGIAADDAAELPLDAPLGTQVAIHVVIDGQGSVNLGPMMMCMSMPLGLGSDGGDCTLAAPLGMPVMAMAMAMGPDAFDRWTSITCASQGVSCTFTPLLATTQLAVRFVKKL